MPVLHLGCCWAAGCHLLPPPPLGALRGPGGHGAAVAGTAQGPAAAHGRMDGGAPGMGTARGRTGAGFYGEEGFSG